MGNADVSASPMVKAAMEVLDPKCLIETIDPSARMRMRLLMIGLAHCGFGRVRVTSGRRSLDSQMVLYGYGRTQAECEAAGVPKIYSRRGRAQVTWTTPAASRHVMGLAIDVSWRPYKNVTWFTVARLAMDLGLTWGGDWRKKDYGHFEV